MPNSKQTPSGKGSTSIPDAKALSRRDFLRIAGVSGAAIGLAGGLGGVLAACGQEETTTTGAAATTTTAALATTSTAAPGSTTSVSASAETGREIKLGFVTPLTGPIALFGVPDQYCVSRWKESVLNGLVCGDGKNHPVTIIVEDSQSDTNRAAQVAGDLINNSKVDAIMAASTPDTCNPVADQAEATGTPCFTNDAPWQDYFYGRGGDPKVGFKWTYHYFWGLEDIEGTFTDMWNSLTTNKVMGGLWPNDADGNSWSNSTDGFPAVMPAAGYKVVDPGRYQNGTEDFTSQITQYKNGGCEILTGVPVPPDFANMWKQCAQQGFKPKIATVGKALLFPQAVESLGELGNLVSTEVWWTPRHPFKSSLTGETCQQVADDFQTRTGMQWTQPLLHYAVFEVVADALKRSASVDDKEAIVGAISKTKLDTLAGPIDFTSPVADGSLHPVKNVYRSPLVGGQWVKGSGKYPYELLVVDNKMAPQIKVEGALQPLPT
jgi:branched-chain amino acid transport system substrate-binding protein